MKRQARIACCALWSLGAACATSQQSASAPDPAGDCAAPSFDGKRTLEEAGSIDESADPCWWLSSGGEFLIDGGHGSTLRGDLPADAEWRKRYATSNPADTDRGAHPQNLLRLVARGHWGDYRQEVRFRIHQINLSQSAERGEWSGVLLFVRYHDADNLYYAGLRMDGTAVIKKKLHGEYTTLAQRPVFGMTESWDRQRHPSLLPLEDWIGLAADVHTDADGAVKITLSTRHGSHGAWQAVAEASDDGAHGAPLRGPSRAGLRADFMDVEFADYAIARVPPDHT